MSDYFFKIWAEEKTKDWAMEAKRDEQARLAKVPTRPSARFRDWLRRSVHALRIRLHRRPAEL